MTNILGPFGPGVNETLTRPAEGSPAYSGDSWFKDCTSAAARDGTTVPSVWLNRVLAQLRRAIRGRNIAEAVSDDDMLLKAINSADREIINIGGGSVDLYNGLDVSGRHQLSSISAGSNVTVTKAVDGEVVISATGGGGGGGGDPLLSIGAGADVYKGLNAGNEEFRSIIAGAGMAVTELTDTVRIAATGGSRKRVATDVNSANIGLSTTIPMGFYSGESLDALPLITHGVQVLSATVTPAALSSKFNIRVQGFGHAYSGYLICAIFRGSTCIKAFATSGITGSNWIQPIVAEVEDAPNTVSPVTYSVRVGPHHPSYPAALNGYYPGYVYGGVNGPVTHMFGAAGTTNLMIDEILE